MRVVVRQGFYCIASTSAVAAARTDAVYVAAATPMPSSDQVINDIPHKKYLSEQMRLMSLHDL